VLADVLTLLCVTRLNFMGALKPKPITVPNLICDNLDGSARVATLMFKDSKNTSDRAQGALAMMQSLRKNQARAAAMGCAVPKGV
jgi:hypothetical protein